MKLITVICMSVFVSVFVATPAHAQCACPIPCTLSVNGDLDLRLPYRSGERYFVTQGYCEVGGHTGYEVDFKLPEGTPVLAVASGTFYLTGTTTDGGKYVWLKHQGAQYVWYSYYGHLQEALVSTVVGTAVNQGEPIALSGWTGTPNSDWAHLHLQIKRGAIDATNGLKARPVPMTYDGVIDFSECDSYVAQGPPLFSISQSIKVGGLLPGSTGVRVRNDSCGDIVPVTYMANGSTGTVIAGPMSCALPPGSPTCGGANTTYRMWKVQWDGGPVGWSAQNWLWPASLNCNADLNLDGVVDGSDLTAILSTWGTSGGSVGGDINDDGIVDGLDLSVVLSGWGACFPGSPGPPWATVLEWTPNPAVVTNVTLRNAIIATGLPWRVRDTSSNIEMLLVPPGTFTMGCSASTQYGCYSAESPTHQVTLTQAFYMGRYEVTQAQWTAKMGSNPSYFVGYSDSPSRPVERVSWNMIASTGGFNSVTGLRLPTEAEWEYAYRAETTTAFHSYPAQPNGFNDDTLLGNIAWYSSQTHAVGGKLANGFGLHDMSGNVWEWCQDWYGPYSSGSVTNPTGPTTGTSRLLRGGNWGGYSDYCRASQRSYDTPGSANLFIGFRVARTP